MKKTITLLLTLCLLLCLLPTEAVAYLGDIQTVDSGRGNCETIIFA